MSVNRPRGFTLVELLLGLIVAGLVAAAALRVLTSQERTANAMDRMARVRSAVQDAAIVLRSDLRSIAPPTHGIYELGESLIEFRATTGLAIVCALDSARSTLTIPEPDSAAHLASWPVAPGAGDTALLYVAAADPDSARWVATVLQSPPRGGATCLTDFLAPGVRTGLPGLTLQLSAPIPPGVAVGTALRFTRRSRYQLYRAADGAWYLGFTDCTASRAEPCATLQPVSGPYAPGGVRFAYRDSAGIPTTDPLRVARIDAVILARTRTPLNAPGLPISTFTDSISIAIAPRNVQ